MVDSEALENAIKESGLQKAYLCDKLEMSYATLRKKVHGESDFTLAEAKTLASLLGLTGRATRLIFFK